jgi:short-subunit dehydrogenase
MTGNVLISGASSGIGAAIATLLVERGYRVFGTSRDPGKSAQILGVEMIALDIRDQDSVQRCVGTVLDRAGSIDMLINNAGYALVGAVEESTDAEIADQFDVNFYGLVRLTRAVLPSMRERRRGHIINISSLAAGVAIPFMGFYSATKAAIEAYSEALLHEVTPFGICVSVIEPPFIRTGLSDNSASAAAPIAAFDGLRRSVTESIRHQVETGPQPSVVAKSVLGVLESKRPRFRNPVGNATVAARLGSGSGLLPSDPGQVQA